MDTTQQAVENLMGTATQTDQTAQLYLKRSEYFQQHGVTEGWEGIAALESK